MSSVATKREFADATRKLEQYNAEIAWEKLTPVQRLWGNILMTVQKINAPSVALSPAVISLLFVIVLQFGAMMWWASGISKDSQHADKEIEDLKSANATLKVYIDTSREKQVKLEAAIETLEKQQQQTTLLLQMKGK